MRTQTMLIIGGVAVVPAVVVALVFASWDALVLASLSTGVVLEIGAEALVAEKDLAAARGAREQLERHLALAASRIGEREGARRAVGSGEQMTAQAPVPARVAAAVAVAGGVGERPNMQKEAAEKIDEALREALAGQ